MSIQTELTRITNAKAAIKTAIEGKGVTVPDGTLLDGMAALIESIEAGGSDLMAATGVYTPAKSVTGFEIVHNLGKIPSLAGYMPYAASEFSGKLVAVCGLYVNGVSYCYSYNGAVISNPWVGTAKYDLQTTSPPKYPSTSYFVSAWGATAERIQFGNADASASLSFITNTYRWFVIG